MTLQNEKFEELLARQLTRELEPQRGKAAAAFAAQVAVEATERAAAQREARRAAAGVAGGSKNRESWARREVSGRALWLWTGIPSLIAAALAVVVTLHFTRAGTRPAQSTEPEHQMVINVPVAPPMPAGSEGAGVGNGSLAAQVGVMQSPPSGVVILYDPQIREIHQQTIVPSQWVDPVDHAYRFAEPAPEKAGLPPEQPK